MTATTEVIMMGDGKNEGLGCCICLDENQDHEHEAIMKDMRKLCSRIPSSQLMEKEARQVLHQSLILKFEYKMRLTSLTQKQCKPISKPNRQVILPPMSPNRNIPGAE